MVWGAMSVLGLSQVKTLPQESTIIVDCYLHIPTYITYIPQPALLIVPKRRRKSFPITGHKMLNHHSELVLSKMVLLFTVTL